MNIIVVGIGKVGYTVAEQLAQENHDVTIVDTNPEVLEEANSALDVIGVCGNGAARRVLLDAGARECDLLIALTGSDEVNLLCCLIAKKLGAKGTIARVRNPEYNEELGLIKGGLGLSMAVNPEREAAAEILRILKFPSAMNIDIFANGRVDLVSFVADKRCTLCGKPIWEAFSKIKAKALICAVERGNEVFIPSGGFVIEENDVLAAIASPAELPSFFKEIGCPVSDVVNVMIIGGGRIAHYLAVEFGKLNMNITIIEKEKAVAEDLSYLLPHANIIRGDGTNRSLLLEEGLCEMDAVCNLTGFDEENILLSLYVKSIAPKVKTITKVNRTAFQEAIRPLDIGSVIYPKYTTSNLILQHVRARKNNFGNNLETLAKIIDNKVEALEFHVGEESGLANHTLEELTLKKNVLVAYVNRGKEAFIPHGKDVLKPGDSVIVVTTIRGLTDLDDIKEQ